MRLLLKNMICLFGVYIQSVFDFSSAQIAGLRVGDIITSIDGKKVQSMDEINAFKKTKNIGDKIEIEIYRDGEKIKTTLTLISKP